MSLPVIQMLCPESKYNIKCPYSMDPSYITVHNTANDAGAKAEISYMISNNNYTSYHLAVDEQQAVQGLPLNRNGFHAGDGNGTGNRRTIGIEICYSKSGGAKFHKAEENAAYLVAALLKQRGWGIDRVKKHQDWSGKYCPHRTLDEGWGKFIELVRSFLNRASDVTYKVHQQTYGWLPFVSEGEVAGYTGRSKRMESYVINSDTYDFEYMAHQQTYGDTDWKTNGQECGVTGQSKRIEGIAIRCFAKGTRDQVDIRYRVHIQGQGWLPWVRNGEYCGTKGQSLRAEAMQIEFLTDNK